MSTFLKKDGILKRLISAVVAFIIFADLFVIPVYAQNNKENSTKYERTSETTLPPNTFADWIVAMLVVNSTDEVWSWNYFHKQVQDHIVDSSNSSIESELTINYKENGKTTGKVGRADLYTNTDGILNRSKTYIWEVKPVVYGLNATLENRAINTQLKGYVDSDESYEKGNNSGIDLGKVSFPSKEGKYEIEYEDAGNGLILYRFSLIDEGDKKEEPVYNSVPDTEPKSENDNLRLVIVSVPRISDTSGVPYAEQQAECPISYLDPVVNIDNAGDKELQNDPIITPSYSTDSLSNAGIATLLSLYICSTTPPETRVVSTEAAKYDLATRFLTGGCSANEFILELSGSAMYLFNMNLDELINEAAKFQEDENQEITEENLDKLREDYINAGNAPAPRDPLVIDLGSKGIELTDVDNGVHFDLDKNGFAEQTSWIGIEDGFLVLDRNDNGVIDDGGELFGDQVILNSGKISSSGFEALHELDENKDNIIDKNDSSYEKLYIWIDANHNGLSESGELKELTQLNIASISLNCYESNITDEGTGTLIAESSEVRFADNSTTIVSEFWFPVDTSSTTQWDGDKIIATIGNIPDIKTAISEDGTGKLLSMYNAFDESDSIAAKRYYLKKILYFITEAEDVPINARGANIDARDLQVIERFMGTEFVGVDGGNCPNVNASKILNKMYSTIENMYYSIVNYNCGKYDNIYMYKYTGGRRFINASLLYYDIINQIYNGQNVDLLIYDFSIYLSNIDCALDTSAYEDFKNDYLRLENLIPNHIDFYECFDFSEVFNNANSGVTYLGTKYADEFKGGADNNFIFGEAGNDSLRGNSGIDIIFGGDGNDSLYGESGNDNVFGDDGYDNIYGGSGNDFLCGDNGNDLLDGGTGNDILIGDDGDDTYIFAKGYGEDIIYDAFGLNTIRLKGITSKDILVNGTGEYDAVIMIKGTNDRFIIKDFLKGIEFANYDLEFDNIKMYVTDKNSPFRHIYGGNSNDVLKAVVDDSFIHAFDGNDKAYGSKGNDIIYGNGGDDSIYAGNGDDIVYGGNGDDILDGGKGNDFLYGGCGNDTYILGRYYGTDIISDIDGVSTIKMTEGISLDELDIISVGEDVVITVSRSENKLIVNGFAENPDNYILEVNGESVSLKDGITTDESEFLSGSEESDYIVNEISFVIAGGSGDDRIIGNDEDEIIFGDRENDQILSGDGNDVIIGGNGDDYINGGDGNDMIDGGSNNDFINGGTGDDTYLFSPGCGNDSIKDSDGANTIIFGDGFTASSIKVYRSDWNDLLITFDGCDDTLTIKNYCIDVNARNFTFVFADGTVVEAAAQDSPLRKVYGTDGSEYMESIYDDGIINDAQESNDQIVGSDGNDMLYGGNGDERITGKAGDDILDGGKGNDYLNGGAGNDTYIFNKGYGIDAISDGEGTNTINIYGYSVSQIKAYRTNWNDITITFADSEDKIVIDGFFTSEANRYFYLTFNGGGIVHATASNSPLRTIYGTDDDEYIAAMDDRGVTLYGENGADNLNGGRGADRLYGGIGNDQLYGNGGSDILDGGEGDDMLYGGAGNDTYIFNVGSGTDTIIDSEGINTISFGAGLPEDAMTAYRHNWNDLMITFEGVEDKLIIQGYFSSDCNRNFEVRFADGTRYAYDNAENPIMQIHASEYDDWMTAWSDKGIELHGDGGNDNLTGGAGNDKLFGGIGNDSLNGNDGDDILDGREGNDFLYGGLGNDTYKFGIGYGSDIIEDCDGNNQIIMIGIDLNEALFELEDIGLLIITIIGTNDVLTIHNFESDNLMLVFDNNISGTFNYEKNMFEKVLAQE